jgi:type III secretion protein T
MPAVTLSDEQIRWLLAVGLATARAFGMIQMLPLFSWMRIHGPIKLAVAAGLAAAAAPPLAEDAGGDLDWIILALLGAKEAAIGAALGIVLALPLWAAQAAGDVIDTQRGANLQSTVDPSSAPDVTTGGRLFLCVAMVWFVSFGGIELMAETLDRSFGFWPSLSFLPQRPLANPALAAATLTALFRSAALIAAPLILVSLIVDAVIALSSRMSERIPLDMARDGAKSVLFLVPLPVYVTLFPGIMSQHVMPSLREALRFLDIR